MIDFEVATHTYRDTATGLVIPSVTTVIRESGMMDGAEFFTESARLRGTAVHAACHYLDEGDLDESWAERNEQLAGYLRAWQRFKVEARFQPKLIEHRVSSPLGYAGTLDRTGILGASEVVNALIDLKTGPHQRWHAIQSAAYAGAIEKPRRFRRLTVRLDADGGYDVIEHPSARYTEDFTVFLAALKLHQWRANGSTANHDRA